MSDETTPAAESTEEPAEGSLNALLAAAEAPDAAPSAPAAAPQPDVWTPERIEAERARLSGFAAKVDKRDRKLNDKLATYKAEQERDRAARAHIEAQVQRLRTGDAATVMEALGALTGRDAKELYTEISLALARNGKPAPDAETKALRAEIEALKQAQSERDARAAAAQDNAVEAELSATLVEMASDVTAFPLLSLEAAEDPKGLVRYAGVIAAEEHARSGKLLALSEILGQMEKQIRARVERLQPGQGASQAERGASPPEGKSEPAPPTSIATKPEAAQRSPGRTLSLDQAAQDSGRKRPMTESERMDLATQLLSKQLQGMNP